MITPAQFRIRYPQLTGVGEDATLTVLIADAVALIAGYLGWPETDAGLHTLAQSTYTLYIDAPSPLQADVLCLCVHPIVSVTSVHADLTRVYGAGTLLTPGTDYAIDARDGILLRAAGSAYSWQVGYRAQRVVLAAGYATTPPGLQAIICATVRHLWDLRNIAGQSSYSYGGDSATLTDANALLPQSAKDALIAYQICA